MDSIPSPLPLELSAKQRKHIEELSLCVSTAGIDIHIDTDISFEKKICVDVEHDEKGNLVLIGVYDGVFYCGYTKVLPSLIERFKDAEIIAHNGVSDIECLRMWGINVRDEQLVHDTMLLSHILDSSKRDYSLKGLAERELGISYPSYDDIVGKRGLKSERITLDKQPLELVSLYNAMDCYVTYKLYERQKKDCENL